MRLHNLANIHTVRHTKRIQNDIHRRTIRQERHILNGQHPRDDALIAMTPGHLIARANLTLLRNAHAYQLIDAWRELIVILARENLDLNYLATLTMRHTQRGVLDLTGLLTEDCTQQLLFGGQFGFTFRSDLANQNVLWPDLGTNIDDSSLVKVAQALFTNVWNIAGDLFGA